MAPVPGALKSAVSPSALRAVASSDHAEYPQFSADAYEALADDMPSRFRPELMQYAKKHALEEHDQDTPQKNVRTSNDSFTNENDSGWDFDDSQLYSGESLLLTSDAPPSSPVPASDAIRTPSTSAQLLTQFLEALEYDAMECDTEKPRGTLVRRVEAEVVLQPSSITQLYGLLRRCTRDTEKALSAGVTLSDGIPRTLLDVDAQLLSGMLSKLETTMGDSQTVLSPDMEYANLEKSLQDSMSLLLSAKCCLLTFSVDQLPKYLFSEELLERCLDILKLSLETLVLPLVEACASITPSGIAHDLLRGSVPSSLTSALDSHMHHVCSALTLLEPLFSLTSITIPEALMIRCVYIALSPLFTQDRVIPAKHASDLTYTHAHALRPLRLSCFHILRNLFAFYPQQRAWIVGEILVSILRLPDLRQRKRHFRLANNQKIYVITALLLQLIQASSYELPASHELSLAWFFDAETRAQHEKPPCQSHQEHVHALASTIAAFLIQKSGEAKMAKNTADVSYAAIVYAILEDLLTLVPLPDWPAAPVLLSCFMRLFVNVLNEPKSTMDAKTMALDHLGLTAAYIYSTKEQPRPKHAHLRLNPMSVLSEHCDVDALHEWKLAYFGVIQRVQKDSKDKATLIHTRSFHRAQYLFDLALAMRLSDEKDHGARFETAITQCVQQVDRIEGVPPIDSYLYAQYILQGTTFIKYAYLLKPLVQAARSPVLTIRLRALRGLANVVGSNSNLLDDSSILDTVVMHLSDTSANVREVCVSILAAYLEDKPAQVPTYLAMPSDRVMDTAVSVRKRVIRFLRDAYLLHLDYDTKLMTLFRMLQCVHDIDPTAQVLAMECLEYVLFNEQVGEKPTEMARLLADLCIKIRERPSPLEEFLRRLGRDHANPALSDTFGELVDELISGLFVDNMDAITMRDRLRVVHVLCYTHPSVLTVNRAKQLLPYVDGAESFEELAVMEELLRIFSTCLCHMPRTARAFAVSLEAVLTRLLSRCTISPGSSTLEALIQCFCCVIQYQTKNYVLLQKTYHSCLGKFFSVQPKEIDANASLVLCITALLCAYGPWQSAQQSNSLDEVFGHLMRLHASSEAKSLIPILTALGYILSAYPAKFLDPTLTSTLDTILQQGTPHERYLVLRAFFAFLENDAGKEPQLSSTDMLSNLTGKAYSDAGLASGLIQRFAEPVLHGVLEVESPPIQRMASDILRIAVLQGLSHPMQVVPTLVALETSQDSVLRSRAAHLHRHLYSKHASLLVSRYNECIRASFQFQCSLTQHPRGYQQDAQVHALFQTWYDILGENRSMRLAFLRTLTRLLSMSAECTDADVDFGLFVADNLALLEYRVVEEPLLVIHELKVLHAVMGGHMTSLIERKLRTDENQRTPSPLTDEECEDIPKPKSDLSSAASSFLALSKSVCIARMIPALRQHIKRMYKLSERKCASYEPGKRTTMGDRITVRASSDPNRCLFDFDLSLPQTYSEAREYLEEFVDERDDAGTDSELEYE